MKYLRGINHRLFESESYEESCEEISIMEVGEFERSHKREQFSDRDRSEVKTIFNSTHEFSNIILKSIYQTPRVRARESLPSIDSLDIDIFKYSDDWFMVRMIDKSGRFIFRYFLCDQLDGIKEFKNRFCKEPKIKTFESFYDGKDTLWEKVTVDQYSSFVTDRNKSVVSDSEADEIKSIFSDSYTDYFIIGNLGGKSIIREPLVKKKSWFGKLIGGRRSLSQSIHEDLKYLHIIKFEDDWWSIRASNGLDLSGLFICDGIEGVREAIKNNPPNNKG